MQNPILKIMKNVTHKDAFSMFGFLYKFMTPSLVRSMMIVFLKDHSFDKEEVNEPVLETQFFSQKLSSPLGLAAGFDANAEVIDELCYLGLGFGELGTYTGKNDDVIISTRFFRNNNAVFYHSDGYANPSCKQVAPKLASRRGRKNMVGVSVGESQTGKDPAEDIVKCLPVVAPFADYVVLNLSNSDFRAANILQNELKLHTLMSRAKEVIKAAVPLKPCPLFVKVPSDLSLDAKRVLVERCFSAGVDGLEVSGPVLKVPEGVYLREREFGGAFCGSPIAEDVDKLVKEYYYLTAGKLPIISTGGIMSGRDAYRRIRAGASLVQIYSALLYKGPAVIPAILKELASLLKADGFTSVADAVGADLKKKPN